MKCVILGDSISEGIGGKKINYCDTLYHLLQKYNTNDTEIDIRNLSLTGTTIKYPLEHIEKVMDYRPDVVIIFYGNVDAQIRPDVEKNRFYLWSMVPKRYHIGGMLNPRPFYSRKWYRWFPDRLDNIFRFLLTKIMYLTQGRCQLVILSEFAYYYDTLMSKVATMADMPKIICCSTVYLNEKIYRGSNMEYEKYNIVIKEMAKKYNASYIDLYSMLHQQVAKSGFGSVYYRDHFHPNEQGYDLIAQAICQAIIVK